MSSPLEFLLDNVGDKSAYMTQAIQKIKKFGLSNVVKGKTETARDKLQTTLTDLLASIEYLNVELERLGHEPLTFEDNVAIDKEIHQIEHFSKISLQAGILSEPLPYFETETPRWNEKRK